MRKRLLAIAMLTGGSLFAQVSVGIRIGPPPQTRIVRVQPVSPGVGYSWVEGYAYPENGRYRQHAGYWTRPPYEGAVWNAPRYENGSYYQGYWNGRGQERFDHNHKWDRDHRNRDYNRDHH
jgi:hypothetical protein